MSSFLDPVDHSIATKWLRFANYLIDLIAMLILIIIIAVICELMGFSFVYYFEQNPLMDRVFSAAFYFLFMSFQEIVFNGRSLGKLITGTMVVMEDGSTPTSQNYLIRNLCRLIPFDAVSYLFSTGWHDSISKTRVVNKKEFDQNMQKFNAIDQIGEQS